MPDLHLKRILSAALAAAALIMPSAVRAQSQSVAVSTNTAVSTSTARTGILVIADLGTTEWRNKVDAAVAQFPLAQRVLSGYDTHRIQKVVDSLTDAGAKKIVVVPLYLFSTNECLDQTKYILGINENPSEAFVNQYGYSWITLTRTDTNLPIVMTSAIDSDKIMRQAVNTILNKYVGEERKYSFILVSMGSEATTNASKELETLDDIVYSMRTKQKIETLDSFILRRDLYNRISDDSQKDFREGVKESIKQGKSLVMGLSLEDRELDKPASQLLDGLLYTWCGTATPSSDDLADFIRRKVKEAAGLPNMRKYTKPGKKPEKDTSFKKKPI